MTGSGGERIGKLFEEDCECEDVGGESIGGWEIEESEDGGGESANAGGERVWKAPGVTVLFSDFGREVAKGDGGNGEASMAGMKEGGRVVSGHGFGISGSGRWVRGVGVSAPSVSRAGGGVWIFCGGGVEPRGGSGGRSFFGTIRRREGVDSGRL